MQDDAGATTPGKTSTGLEAGEESAKGLDSSQAEANRTALPPQGATQRRTLFGPSPEVVAPAPAPRRIYEVIRPALPQGLQRPARPERDSGPGGAGVLRDTLGSRARPQRGFEEPWVMAPRALQLVQTGRLALQDVQVCCNS